MTAQAGTTRRHVRIQIAGVSTIEDALAVERAGVEAIGLTLGLPGGPHNGLDEGGARAIIRALPPFIEPVLITYLATPDAVVPLCRFLGLLTVQLHGGATSAAVATMRRRLPGLKVIRAVHVTDAAALDDAASAAVDADALILDTYDPLTGRHGATGLTHDWQISRRIVAASPKPVILAGGLRPENIGEALRTVGPWAVDTHTGIERADGSMDHQRLRAFVAAVRAAD